MTQGLYWFGLNVPTSSFGLLVLLALKVHSRGLQTGERGTGLKSLVERSNGCQELSHGSAMCSRFDASGSAVMRCEVR